MPVKQTVPFLSLAFMLKDLRYNWHSDDYYIAPDENIGQPRFLGAFRPQFYAMILCTQGWMDLIVNGELVHIDEYKFFAGGPNMIVQRAGQSSDCKNKAVFFTKEFLVRNFNSFRQFEAFHFFSTHFNNCIALSGKEARPLIQLYEILREKRNAESSSYHTEIIRNLIFAYVYETAIIYQSRNLHLPSRFAKEVNVYLQFQDLVAKHGIEQHQLRFYADALFVTPKYLIQAIKKATGKTPGAVIDEAIVIAAKIQLKTTTSTLGQIAESLHFSDQASFSRFFKKHTGISPASFRKHAEIS